MIKKFKVDGMRCEHCKKRVENGLSAEGFKADADIVAGVVTVEGENLEIDAIKNAIEDLGFDFLGEE